jgi:plasmid stability protein
MAQLVVRNLSEDVKEYWRERAKQNGRSLEAEIRTMLVKEAQQSTVQAGAQSDTARHPGVPSGLESKIAALLDGNGFDDEDIARIEALRRPPLAQALDAALDAEAQTRLRERAAAHGRSLEAEVLAILGDVVTDSDGPPAPQGRGFATAVRNLFKDEPFLPGEIQELRGNWTRPAEFD